jgi:serine protease Do
MRFLPKLTTAIKLLSLITILSIGTISIPHIHDLLLINKASNVVFKITKVGHLDGSSGTGFSIEDSKGRKFTVTNYHVCVGLTNESGELVATASARPNTSHTVRILIASILDDVCILTPIERGEAPLKLSSGWYIGQRAHLMGHPLGDLFRKSSGEIVGSKLITVYQYIGIFSVPVNYEAIQITNFARGGNSGSPVLNDLGNVLGILFAGDSRSEHISYIIPADRINRVLQKVK